MSERFDDLIARLVSTPTDRSLDGLDAEIGRSILRRRHEARTVSVLAPLQMASLGLALAVGVTAGGAAAISAASKPQSFGAFSSVAHLAPSMLLEGEQ